MALYCEDLKFAPYSHFSLKTTTSLWVFLCRTKMARRAHLSRSGWTVAGNQKEGDNSGPSRLPSLRVGSKKDYQNARCTNQYFRGAATQHNLVRPVAL